MTAAIEAAVQGSEMGPLQKMEALGKEMALSPVTQLSTIDNGKKISRLAAKVERYQQLLKRVEGDLLGFEQGAVNEVLKRVSRLEHLIWRLECKQRNSRLEAEAAVQKARKQEHLASKYHLISMEPLEWRNADGHPVLAVFATHSATCEIVIRPDATVQHIPTLPDSISVHYKDLAGLSSRRSVVGLRCGYRGFIPQEVKVKMKQAEKDFPKIFIIAEVEQWSVTEESASLKRDPLVVGWWDDRLWLIASYDTTDIEAHAFFTLPELA